MRILPLRQGKSLRPSDVHRLHGRWRLRRMGGCARGLCLIRFPNRFPITTSCAAAVRRIIGFPLLAPFRYPVPWASRLLRFRLGRARRDPRWRATRALELTRPRAARSISSLRCSSGQCGRAKLRTSLREKLDAAIVFAPAGELVPPALKALKKLGVLVLGGIHMSPIPSFDYNLLYQEGVILQGDDEHAPGSR